MSSFIGHGLAAVAIGKGFSEKTRFKHKWLWLTFLLLCAYAPDVDYIVKFLNKVHNADLRITHSIIFSLLLPLLGMIYLYFFDRKNVFWGGLQASLAGLSHLILDTLVGSKEADPLLFPFLLKTFKLPFGILPSSAKVDFSNYYFYRNIFIECGILIPAFLLILHFTGRVKLGRFGLVLSIISLPIFLFWSINLAR